MSEKHYTGILGDFVWFCHQGCYGFRASIRINAVEVDLVSPHRFLRYPYKGENVRIVGGRRFVKFDFHDLFDYPERMDNLKPNQEVINPLRTEWGVGKVLSVEPGPGGKGVRVRVNFSGAGVKTMMIPPGQLVAPETRAKTAPLPADPTTDVIANRLRELPAIVFDTKAELEVRLGALIELYRFNSDTRGIFDWAIHQLQEKDPLEYFTADELKAYFDDFCRMRDHWLKKLHQQATTTGRLREFEAYLDRKASGQVRERIGRLF